jgi:hypothetical protein
MSARCWYFGTEHNYRRLATDLTRLGSEVDGGKMGVFSSIVSGRRHLLLSCEANRFLLVKRRARCM